MSQINVNVPDPGDRSSSGDRSAAAGINLITVLIVLAVLAVVAWYLFTGPLRSMGSSQPTVNVNPSAPTINVNPPSAPAPANNSGATTGNDSSGNNNAPAPAKP